MWRRWCEVGESSEYGSSSVDSWRDKVLWPMVDVTNAVGNIRIAYREEKQRDRKVLMSQQHVRLANRASSVSLMVCRGGEMGGHTAAYREKKQRDR